MSTTVLVLISVAAYLLGGIGTARAVFARNYKREHAWWTKRKATLDAKVKADSRNGYHYLTGKDQYAYDHTVEYCALHDSDTYSPAVWAGVFWPLVLPYLALVRPVGTVLVPLVVKWFLAPARRAVSS